MKASFVSFAITENKLLFFVYQIKKKKGEETSEVNCGGGLYFILTEFAY
jgi:hypothetical protein